LVLASLICINAHAVLVSPTPFNSNPTTANPCGTVDGKLTTDMTSIAMATWAPGQEVTILWHLIASDGGGTLRAVFDPNGGTNFSVPAVKTITTAGSGVFYNYTFNVPNSLSCDNSPTKLCTMRVYTTSNWNSCTTVKICEDCLIAPEVAKTCAATTTPLSFCPNVPGVEIPQGYSPSDIDSQLGSVFTANLNNPNVFTSPTGDCPALYKTLLCGLSLPQCNPSTNATVANNGACKSQCQKALQACKVTDLHKNLYDCDSLPQCVGGASGGGMSPGGAAALSIFLIALVASVAVAGYVYHKQGHLFGYKYDTDKNKVVKVAANPHNYTAYVDNEYKI